MPFKHEDFLIGSTYDITMKKGKGDNIEGRVIDLYKANEKDFAIVVKQGSFFHNIVKLEDVKSVRVLS